MLYKNQTLLNIEMETGLVTLVDATTKAIIITRPDGFKVIVNALVSGTKLTYAVPAGLALFNQPGVYQFQGSYIVGDRQGLTEIVEKIFYDSLLAEGAEEYVNPTQPLEGNVLIFQNGVWTPITLAELSALLNNIPIV